MPSVPPGREPEIAGAPATGTAEASTDELQTAPSETAPERERHGPGAGSPLDEQGAFTVECKRCRQTSRVGLLDLVIFQFPLGYWLPKGRYDHRMTCPSCRRRTWCSVTLRRG